MRYMRWQNRFTRIHFPEVPLRSTNPCFLIDFNFASSNVYRITRITSYMYHWQIISPTFSVLPPPLCAQNLHSFAQLSGSDAALRYCVSRSNALRCVDCQCCRGLWRHEQGAQCSWIDVHSVLIYITIYTLCCMLHVLTSHNIFERKLPGPDIVCT